MTWIAWEKNSCIQGYDGFEIGSLKVRNIALMGKWRCRFKVNANNIQAGVIKSIYGANDGFSRPIRTRLLLFPKYLKKIITLLDHFHLTVGLKWDSQMGLVIGTTKDILSFFSQKLH